MSVATAVAGGLQGALVAAGAPLVVGVTRQVRARLEGRAGAGVAQPWRELRKLVSKQRVVADTTSWVFEVTPVVLVATSVLAAVVVPVVTTASAFDRSADLLTVIYMLLLGSVFLALAGLDAGTAFGGMGASRSVTIAALAEPTIVLAVFGLSVRVGSTNLGRIVRWTLEHPGAAASPESLLALGALAVVTLAEAGRLPIDNPSTHLELTMIHEAMVLEYAGPDLAMVELAAHVRITVFLALLANLSLPWGIATTAAPVDLLAAALVAGAKLALLGGSLAAFEVFVAKLRLFRVPELLAASLVLAFLAVTASFFLA